MAKTKGGLSLANCWSVTAIGEEIYIDRGFHWSGLIHHLQLRRRKRENLSNTSVSLTVIEFTYFVEDYVGL